MIDSALVGVWARVGEVGASEFLRGREAGEIECGATEEGEFAGFWRRGDVL